MTHEQSANCPLGASTLWGAAGSHMLQRRQCGAIHTVRSAVQHKHGTGEPNHLTATPPVRLTISSQQAGAAALYGTDGGCMHGGCDTKCCSAHPAWPVQGQWRASGAGQWRAWVARQRSVPQRLGVVRSTVHRHKRCATTPVTPLSLHSRDISL